MKENLSSTAHMYPLEQNFKEEKLPAYFWMPHLVREG